MTFEERVRGIVAVVAELPPEEFDVQADLRLRFAIDSLQGLLIIAQLGEAFDLELDVHGLDSCRSVRDIVAVVSGIMAPGR